MVVYNCFKTVVKPLGFSLLKGNKHLDHKMLIAWLLEKTEPQDKTGLLLEHYLLLHFKPESGIVEATRKQISSFLGCTFKTTNKALDILQEEGRWDIKENDFRIISFAPIFKKEGTPENNSSAVSLSEMVRHRSSLSGNSLLVSLIYSESWNPDLGYAEESIRNVAKRVGLSSNTVRRAIGEMEESKEWERIESEGKIRLKPNMAILSLNNSAKRMDPKGSNASVNLLKKSENTDSSIQPNLPFMLDNLDEMHGRNIQSFTRRRSNQAYAKRLIENTDLSTRKSKKTFNIDNLVRLYADLREYANIEIVDTLMTYQCTTGGALDLRFLRPVAARVEKTLHKKAPVKFSKEKETSGAYITALAVWKIIEARKTPAPAKKSIAYNRVEKPIQEAKL